MNKKIKIIFAIVVIILVGVVIYLSIDMNKKVEEIRQSNSIEKNNIMININNELPAKNNIEEVSNNIKNEISNNIENTVKENNNVEENTNTEVIVDEQDAEKTAINIVKQNWGNDNNVYFSYDGIDSNDNYIIAVRDKSTTQVLAWYEVDIKNKTFIVR